MPLLKDDNTVEGETKREQEKRLKNEAILREWAKEEKNSQKPSDPFSQLDESASEPLIQLDKMQYSRYRIAGIDIKCPVCGHNYFLKNTNMTNSRVLTFLRLDWLDEGATTLRCFRCGNMLWMHSGKPTSPLLLIGLIALAIGIAYLRARG